MKTKAPAQIGITEYQPARSICRVPVWFALLACLATARLDAATVPVYTNDFEGYSNVATNLSDAADTDPIGFDWNIVDDTALNPTTAGAGVQVINWLSHWAQVGES